MLASTVNRGIGPLKFRRLGIMPAIAKSGEQHIGNGAQGIPSMVYMQPWWCGFGSSTMNSSEQNINGSQESHFETNADGSTKKFNATAPVQAGTNESADHEHVKHVIPSPFSVMGGHIDNNSQRELVGHSIVLTPYTCPDASYGGIMTYGPQVHPYLIGTHGPRMPLPLEMEEEPVYVNAKQYHGILRRRQSRAKAELENKLLKARKPYLHESRHQHAMRRARGSGGRFLNTKKSNSDATNSSMEKEATSNTFASTQPANSSVPEHLRMNYCGISDEQGKSQNAFQDMQNPCFFSSGNCNVSGLSSMYHPRFVDSGDGRECLIRERGSILLNQASNGPTPIK